MKDSDETIVRYRKLLMNIEMNFVNLKNSLEPEITLGPDHPLGSTDFKKKNTIGLIQGSERRRSGSKSRRSKI
jgi:hypothetical protein